MKLLMIYIVIGAGFTAIAEGLQCYVCEDCNEYQDFKELHICGEIPVVVTPKPSTVTENLPTTTTKTTTTTTKKPSSSAEGEDYLYDYSMESLGSSGSTGDRGGNTTAISTTPSTKTATTTQTVKTETTSTTTTTTTTPSTTSATSSKPVQIADDYDYMEYEEGRQFNIDRQEEGVEGSLLKVDKPVCYMYRYYENNTVFTNRGCTTLLNASKFLTCQALANGTPMVGCRICTTDGCNKFDLDESGEDHMLNAGVPQVVSAILIAILGVVISAMV